MTHDYTWDELATEDGYMGDAGEEPARNYHQAEGRWVLQIVYFDQAWQGYVDGVELGAWPTLEEAKRELERIDATAWRQHRSDQARAAAIKAARAALPTFDQGAML